MMATSDRLEEGAPTIEELRERVQQDPDSLEPRRDLGWALYGLDRTEEAIETLSQASEKFPNDPETAYALGLALKRAGRNGEAREAFQQTLKHLDEIEVSSRTDMMRRLSQGQVNLIDHGSWDIPSA